MLSPRPALQRSCCQQEIPDAQYSFVIPPAIEDCGDVPSPSQHRLTYASQRHQACLDSISDDQDQDDDTHSEEEGDAEASNSSGGEEEEQEEDEEQEESKNSEEEEQDDDASELDSEVASSRAPSRQPSSQNRLAMLVQNLQKEVEHLKATSQAHQVDELSAPSLYKRRRFRSPAVQEDEEASGYVDGFASDCGDDTDSAKVRTPRKRTQPRFRFVGSRYSD